MARTVRNAKIDTRSARSKLPTGKTIHWTTIAPGCALGYRKGAKGGMWIAKFVKEGFRREVSLGPADDVMDADGLTALDYVHAQTKAREWFSSSAMEAVGERTMTPGKATITVVMQDYVSEYKRKGGKSLKELESRINAFILPKLGDVTLEKLTTKRLRDWHAEVAATPPRLRTRKGDDQKYRDTSEDHDALRRRQATANRTLTALKAALNYAFHEGKIQSDIAWRRVKPFREADSAKIRYLKPDECVRLVNACGESFRPLVQAALLTGCRYGELTALRCSDFDETAQTIAIRASKGGKPRHVVLGDDGAAFFTDHIVGRASNALVFARPDGTAWGKSHQFRPLADACEAANIVPPANFHILRHTYASHLVQAGAHLSVIAANLGHADTRMTEKHYAHLAPSHIATAIRAALPKLGIVQPRTVVALKRA
ncbi:site-specific integrase [Magnetospirillum sp. 15-1]|uniref:tyrosine-type recombinase/integrase n=1 Tax=Magnetospirillum sp. 15-1 TaxID=1979370 RepID=UPI000BBCEA8B|nr:site-specific integrase [Magnetospirillum sp. 15-1]